MKALRRAEREKVREWARETALTQQVDAPNMPRDWGFFHDPALVEVGYSMWAASGYHEMPTLQDAAEQEPTWVRDMMLRHRLQKRMDSQVKGGDQLPVQGEGEQK